MEQDDSSDIVIVSENIRTPNKKSGSPTRPLAATSSPSSKQRRVSHTTAPFPRTGTSQRAKMEVDESETESYKKRGKKRTRKEEEAVDEYKDERLVSEELKLDAFKDEDDKKDVGSSGSPKKVSSWLQSIQLLEMVQLTRIALVRTSAPPARIQGLHRRRGQNHHRTVSCSTFSLPSSSLLTLSQSSLPIFLLPLACIRAYKQHAEQLRRRPRPNRHWS